MKAPLKKITVLCLKEHKNTVMDIIFKSGAVHITPSAEKEISHKGNDEAALNLKLQRQSEALSILNKYVPEKKSLFPKTKAPALKNINLIDSSNDILFLKNTIDEKRRQIQQNNKTIAFLHPYKNFKLPLKSGSTKNTCYGIFTTEKTITKQLLDTLFEDAYTKIIFSSKNKSAFFCIVHKNKQKEFDTIIREEGFSKTETDNDIPPAQRIRALKNENEELNRDIFKCEQKLKELSCNRDSIKLLYDTNKVLKDRLSALKQGYYTKKAFIINGFVPANKAKNLKDRLESETSCSVILSLPDENDDVPVLLENNIFSSPVEEITKTYSVPSKKDIDPNSIMAVFYYIFFGMMFSDAGYGLLVSLLCGYIAFFSKAEQGFKKTMRLFFYCGISTIFWGFMFGSFFGDAVNVISRTFFGKNYSLKPLWLDPTKEPLILLVFSVALGILQILTGMAIRFYMLFRQKEYKSAFFDVGSWILILLGVVFVATGAVLKIRFVLIFGTALVISGAAVIILTKGRDKKNPVARFFSGILGLYDITGLVSDALSYSRLMALGLSTGVIASVVNMMASLTGGKGLGIIVFTIVFITGHGLNFAINMLGAYVHTNRLQYVEFFSKFYEGGGSAFRPLKLNTKYYEFTDGKD